VKVFSDIGANFTKTSFPVFVTGHTFLMGTMKKLAFMKYKKKPTEGCSEKVNRALL
jgi:hypothetical protein